MTVGEKLRYLRTIEGALRGLDHEMTQQAVAAAVEEELGERISQSYLSQIERGQRPHLTNTTRMTLSRFFKVHPGYLVNDPEGFHTELTSDVRTLENNLDLWLIGGAERFARFPDVRDALMKLALHDDTHNVLVLIGAILDTPGLAERLLQTLRPELSDESLIRASRTVSSARGREGEHVLPLAPRSGKKVAEGRVRGIPIAKRRGRRSSGEKS